MNSIANPNNKSVRKEIEEKLASSLASFEVIIGNKKFNKRIKKAGKAFTKGLVSKLTPKTNGKTTKEHAAVLVNPIEQTTYGKENKRTKKKKAKH